MTENKKRPLIWSADAKAIRELQDNESLYIAKIGIDSCIISPIRGDNDYETRLHYEVRLATNIDFSDEITYRSDSTETSSAWRLLSRENNIYPFPHDGVPAWYEYDTDQYGQMIRVSRGETGSFVLFSPTIAGLEGRFLYRIRAWDINDVAEGETPVSEPGSWFYGVS